MSVIMRATGLGLGMNGVMTSRITLSLFVPTDRFFTKINKRHYTKLFVIDGVVFRVKVIRRVMSLNPSVRVSQSGKGTSFVV